MFRSSVNKYLEQGLSLRYVYIVLKVILGTLTGFGISGSGFYLSYLYILSSRTPSPAWWLGVIGVLLVIAGLVLLFKAGRYDQYVIKPIPFQVSDNSSALAETIAKNNEVVSEWSSTAEKRDKLKLLEMTAAVEERKPGTQE